MPYDSRFDKAVNLQGKPYRDPVTHNLIEYCMHLYIVYPDFETENDYHAGFIPLERKILVGLRGTCQTCGDIIFIQAQDVVKDAEQMDQELSRSINYSKEYQQQRKRAHDS